MRISQKKEIVSDLKEKFEKAAIVLVTDYKGLNVEKLTGLRSQLKQKDVEYRVVKNSLLIRAAEDTGIAVLNPYFKGPSAVAISYDDPVEPAKILNEFMKENDKFEIKAGVMNGKLLDMEAIKALSKLPTREVLLGQMLSAMNAVPAGFVRLLAQVPRGFLNVLQAIKDQKEAA